MNNLKKDDKILVLGSTGMVGSAILRSLNKNKFSNFQGKSSKDLNLISQKKVNNFFANNFYDCVFICAATVGGIKSNNTFPANYIYENLMIEANTIHACYSSGIKKILFLGSSCIYPKKSKQPITENELFKGYLEKTNEPYAVAKIAGIKLCESYNRQFGMDYRSCMPTNLYGSNVNFDIQNSHVIPALIKKIHMAKMMKKKSIKIWGSGKAKRDFLHVDDMAEACLYIMKISKKNFNFNIDPMNSHINIGSGKEITIKNLVKKIQKIIGYHGYIDFDLKMPDGTLKKLLDSNKILNLGWSKKIDLDSGLKNTYKWFLENI